MYRSAGIPLKEISKILDAEKTKFTEILTNRLKRIQSEITYLKKQEKMIIEFFKKEVLINEEAIFDNCTWTELLTSLGFDEEELILWHREFEEDSPVEHIEFLQALGMVEGEIEKLMMKLI